VVSLILLVQGEGVKDFPINLAPFFGYNALVFLIRPPFRSLRGALSPFLLLQAAAPKQSSLIQVALTISGLVCHASAWFHTGLLRRFAARNDGSCHKVYQPKAIAQ
jgi:hypothetical protein